MDAFLRRNFCKEASPLSISFEIWAPQAQRRRNIKESSTLDVTHRRWSTQSIQQAPVVLSQGMADGSRIDVLAVFIVRQES